MRVIGVVDVREGKAVHAVAGHREMYRPVERAGACDVGGDPIALARAYRDEFGLDGVYVADLDAILGGRVQARVVRTMASLPLELWVDAGASTLDVARSILGCGASRVVVGLETLLSYRDLEVIVRSAGRDAVVFSLDIKDNEVMLSANTAIERESPVAVARQAALCGVGTVIVLDMSRVGLMRGVDLSLIGAIRRALPGLSLVCGGGVRGQADLHALKAAGCDGALVATALQQGRLGRLDSHRSTTR